MDKIEFGFICLPKNDLPDIQEKDNQKIIYPKFEIVDVDLQKIDSLNDNNKCKLLDFYKDGLLICANQKKISFFSIIINLKEIEEIQLLTQDKEKEQYFEEDEELIRKMKEEDQKLSKAEFERAAKHMVGKMNRSRGQIYPWRYRTIPKIINLQGYKKNGQPNGYPLEYVSHHNAKWIDNKFKNFLYIIIEDFSKTKALKIDLNQFTNYKELKNFFTQNNEISEPDNYPIGLEKEYFKKILSNYFYKNKLVNIDNNKYYLSTIWQDLMLLEFAKLSGLGEKKGVVEFNSDVKDKIKELLFKDLSIENTELLNEVFEYYKKIESFEHEIEKRIYLFKLMSKFANLNISQLKNILNLDSVLLKTENSHELARANLKEKKLNPEYQAIIFNQFYYVFSKLILLMFHSNFGFNHPSGKEIDVSEFTVGDAVLYWKLLPVHMYLNEFIESHQCPAMVKDGKILNIEYFKETGDTERFHGMDVYTAPSIDNNIEEEINTILNEAFENKIYHIPYGSVLELKDENFRYLRLFETLDEVQIFICDTNERFLYDVLCKKTRMFKNFIFNTNQLKDDNLAKIKKDFYTCCATIIRDFWIIVYRDKVLGPARFSVPAGVNTNRKRVIYLPRIKYNYIGNREPIKNELKLIRRSSGGWRTHSIVRLQETHRPSPFQLLLARKNGVLVPENHTYRRAHTWGKKTKTEDEITYRSRSITGLIYTSEKTEHNAKELIEMSPLNFEEYCHEVMSKLGWIITKQRQVDGGIDVEAYKSSGEGQIKRAFVQCKHWSRPVGPDVVRELLGSNIIEGEDYETELFIICSGTFSSGCIELANQHNIKLLDGNDLLKLSN